MTLSPSPSPMAASPVVTQHVLPPVNMPSAMPGLSATTPAVTGPVTRASDPASSVTSLAAPLPQPSFPPSSIRPQSASNQEVTDFFAQPARSSWHIRLPMDCLLSKVVTSRRTSSGGKRLRSSAVWKQLGQHGSLRILRCKGSSSSSNRPNQPLPKQC